MKFEHGLVQEIHGIVLAEPLNAIEYLVEKSEPRAANFSESRSLFTREARMMTVTHSQHSQRFGHTGYDRVLEAGIDPPGTWWSGSAYDYLNQVVENFGSAFIFYSNDSQTRRTVLLENETSRAFVRRVNPLASRFCEHDQSELFAPNLRNSPELCAALDADYVRDEVPYFRIDAESYDRLHRDAFVMNQFVYTHSADLAKLPKSIHEALEYPSTELLDSQKFRNQLVTLFLADRKIIDTLDEACSSVKNIIETNAINEDLKRYIFRGNVYEGFRSAGSVIGADYTTPEGQTVALREQLCDEAKSHIEMLHHALRYSLVANTTRLVNSNGVLDEDIISVINEMGVRAGAQGLRTIGFEPDPKSGVWSVPTPEHDAIDFEIASIFYRHRPDLYPKPELPRDDLSSRRQQFGNTER